MVGFGRQHELGILGHAPQANVKQGSLTRVFIKHKLNRICLLHRLTCSSPAAELAVGPTVLGVLSGNVAMCCHYRQGVLLGFLAFIALLLAWCWFVKYSCNFQLSLVFYICALTHTGGSFLRGSGCGIIVIHPDV